MGTPLLRPVAVHDRAQTNVACEVTGVKATPTQACRRLAVLAIAPLLLVTIVACSSVPSPSLPNLGDRQSGGTALTVGADGGGGGAAIVAPPSCTDQLKNGNESDVDCGGSCAPCPDGRACAGPADCAAKSCTAGMCCTTKDYEKTTVTSDVTGPPDGPPNRCRSDSISSP